MDVQRRNFLRGNNSSTPADIPLPWLKSAAHFYNNCTQCYDCLTVCPSGIVKKAGGGYPGIHFKNGECTFCGECAQACPQELFEYRTDYKPWSFIATVGKACLALHKISCRSCQDSCAYHAIKFELAPGKTPHPEINNDLCTGCGACVSPCPAFAIDIVAKNNTVQPERGIHASQF